MATKLRNLRDDLKTRIGRAEAEETRLLGKVAALQVAEEALRTCRGELSTLKTMLEMAEKTPATKEELPPAA